jgi:superfamily I DNA/RNA helicase
MQVNLIYGPPGTGKTTELMRLLEEELKTVAPQEIAFVSFTKEGTEVGVSRACERFKYKRADFPYFRTLHSLAFRELKLKRTSVIDKDGYRQFSKKMGMLFTGYYTEEFKNNDDRYLFFDELYRNNPKTASVYLPDLDIDKLNFVRKNYAKFKETFALMDFTNMLEAFNKRNEAVPVRVAFIDEAQDLTTLQWRSVWTAFKNCERIYVAGDDDQAIYQWSGADVEYFLSLQGSINILRHSYRLPESVLKMSKMITGQISRRVDKEYEGTGKEGSVSSINSVEEISIGEGTYLFLARNHCFLTPITEIMRKKGVVYSYNGEPSVKSADIEAINLYERVRKTKTLNETDAYKLQYVLKEKYSLSDPWYESFKWDNDKLMYMRDIVRTKPNIHNIKVRISTIHASKGSEADHVYISLDITKTTKHNLDVNPDSEHRAFYVGFTRAKSSLTIIHSGSRYAYPIIGGL